MVGEEEEEKEEGASKDYDECRLEIVLPVVEG